MSVLIRILHNCQRIIWYGNDLRYAHLLLVIHLQPFNLGVYLPSVSDRHSFSLVSVMSYYLSSSDKGKNSSRTRLLLLYVLPQISR